MVQYLTNKFLEKIRKSKSYEVQQKLSLPKNKVVKMFYEFRV